MLSDAMGLMCLAAWAVTTQCGTLTVQNGSTGAGWGHLDRVLRKDRSKALQPPAGTWEVEHQAV